MTVNFGHDPAEFNTDEPIEHAPEGSPAAAAYEAALDGAPPNPTIDWSLREGGWNHDMVPPTDTGPSV